MDHESYHYILPNRRRKVFWQGFSFTASSLEGKVISNTGKYTSLENLVHTVYATFGKFCFCYNKKFSLCSVIDNFFWVHSEVTKFAHQWSVWGFRHFICWILIDTLTAQISHEFIFFLTCGTYIWEDVKAPFVSQSPRGSGPQCVYMSTYENIFIKNTRSEWTNPLLEELPSGLGWLKGSGVLTTVKMQPFPHRSKRNLARASPFSISTSEELTVEAGKSRFREILIMCPLTQLVLQPEFYIITTEGLSSYSLLMWLHHINQHLIILYEVKLKIWGKSLKCNVLQSYITVPLGGNYV